VQQKKKNLRMTHQRKMILEELRKVKNHPSADEVYEIVRKKLPRISLGTVYRNLQILSQSGEIQRLDLGCALKRFDGNPENHYHIRCLGCNRVDDVVIRPLKNVENKIYGLTDYRVMGHRLEFLGLCRNCSQHLSDLHQNTESINTG
jgi:Fe2+ or Zn2+ uptake regulation protein